MPDPYVQDLGDGRKMAVGAPWEPFFYAGRCVGAKRKREDGVKRSPETEGDTIPQKGR